MSKQSKYLKYLPAWFSEGHSESSFANRMLLAFEKVLTGFEDESTEEPAGTGVILDRVADYFDPELAPSQYVPYLAQWTGWDIQWSDDWNRDLDRPSYEEATGDIGSIDADYQQLVPLKNPLRTRNREMIRSIARLHRLRGTRDGIEEFLRIYAGDTNATVQEFHEVMKVGVTSEVGQNTIVGNRPFYFQVSVKITNPGPGVVQEYKRAIRTIVDEEKPAHTQYDLVQEVVGMQIGVRSSVGKDTLLGGDLV